MSRTPPPRPTRMGWTVNQHGTPTVVTHIDPFALKALAHHGGVLLRAPRDAAGRSQLVVLLGPECTEAAAREAVRRLQTAEEDLAPPTPPDAAQGDIP